MSEVHFSKEAEQIIAGSLQSLEKRESVSRAQLRVAVEDQVGEVSLSVEREKRRDRMMRALLEIAQAYVLQKASGSVKLVDA